MEIALNKPLITIETWDGKTHFMEKTIEDYDKNKPTDSKNSLRELETSDGTRLRFSNIKSVKQSTPEEYFWHFISPKIEKHILTSLRSSLDALSDRDFKKITLKQILGYIQRKREEEKYYS